MWTILALFTAAASAADLDTLTTRLSTREGDVYPTVAILIDPPDPDADAPEPDRTLRGDIATRRFTLGEDGIGVTLGLDVGEIDVRAILYRAEAGAEPVVVWGEGASSRVAPPAACRADGELPPGPCTPVDRALPPGPCFELIALLGDGSTFAIEVSLQAEAGWIDPASLVGFNPQPEPPGDLPIGLSFHLDAVARPGTTVQLGLALVADKQLLPLE